MSTRATTASLSQGGHRAAACALLATLTLLLPVVAAFAADTVEFGTPSAPGASVTVKVHLNKTSADAVRSVGVSIQLGTGVLLDGATPAAAITRDTFLDGYSPGIFYSVIDQTGGKYTIDQSLLGTPCGPTVSGDLFIIRVKPANGAVTSGAISIATVPALTMTSCSSVGLALSAGAPVTVTFASSPLGPVTNFTATPILTGNGSDGTRETQLDFTMPAGATAVEIYAAKYGNYPEYDDAPGGAIQRRIDFETPTAPVPGGFEADTGAAYNAILGYGWLTSVLTTARNLNPNDPRDSFAYAFNADPQASVWEINVGAGPHQVHVVCGDPSNQQRAVVTVEGVPFLTNVLTNGGQYAEHTATVTVGADGKLTVRIGGSALNTPPLSHTKIDFIEIGAASGGPAGSTPPVVNSYPPPAGYTLLASPSASPAYVEPPARDYYYYVAYATDGVVRSAPVSTPNGVLNYHLGDVFDAITPAECAGDNVIEIHDLSYFAAAYGLTIPSGDSRACLDIGPLSTTPGTIGLPLTDDVIDIQDLNVFAANYGSVSKAITTPAPAATNALGLEPVAVDDATLRADVRMQGAGDVRAVSVRLGWNPQVLEPIGSGAGDLLDAQGGIALQPAPGSVDFALLGSRNQGLSGDGIVASVRFRRLAPGDAQLTIAAVEAFDLAGRAIDIAARISPTDVSVAPRSTALLGNVPNPFNPTTKISFSLRSHQMVRLAIYSLAGRLVRTLVQQPEDAGLHAVTWDGTDNQGNRVSSGVYYGRLSTADGAWSRPLVLVK